MRLNDTQLVEDTSDGLWKEVWLRNQFGAELLPQLHDQGNGLVSFSGTDDLGKTEFVGHVDALIRRGKLADVRIRVDSDCLTTRLAKHRSKDCFVRPRDRDEGERFLRYIAEHWVRVRELLTTTETVPSLLQSPRLRANLRFDINGSYRAIAKIAFNYLAFRMGSAYARLARFNELREYIRGNNLVLPETAPGGIPVDERFVTALPRGALNMFSVEAHLVGILNIDDMLTGMVTLYAAHTFIVGMGGSGEDIIPMSHEFSVDGSWNRELSLEEMIKRRRTASAIET